MNRSFCHILAVVALFTAAQPAQAQRITSPYRFLEAGQEIGGIATYVRAGDATVGLGAKSGPAFGGRYGIRLGGPFMIEVEGVYFPTEHAVLDSVVVDSAFQQIGTADQTLLIATAALRFNITGPRTWHGLQPFVVLGAGAVIETSHDKDAVNQAPVDARFDFGTSFAGTLGGGIAWLPSRHLAIRLDGRNVLWKVTTPAALRRGDIGLTMPDDEWVQNFTAAAGVSILF
jgi:hypothetical protein